MTKEETVSSLFFLTNKLKDIVKRKGWYKRDIRRFRVERVAVHIYGSQMLAFAMYSEFDYDVDINKVILILAIHEIAEAILGDFTPSEMSREDKAILERKTVIELLDMIPNGEILKALYLEYEDQKTKEAIFAFQVEHAECDLQAKLYVEEGCFSHKFNKDEFVENWIGYDIKRLPYNDNFKELLEYVSINDTIVISHQDNPFQNVISFYKLANSLKDKKRKGEEIWRINKEKYGSIAEHIYSVQMLELIIHLVYSENIDISKVIALTSVHELGEILFGDKDALTKTDEDRTKEYEDAIEIASILTKGNVIIALLEEFNNMKTKEAIFAKYCDKLTPSIISKIYDQQDLVDLNNQKGNKLLDNPIVKKHLDNGASFSSMWILYGQEVYQYPEPLKSISEHILNNTIEEPYSTILSKKLGIKTV